MRPDCRLGVRVEVSTMRDLAGLWRIRLKRQVLTPAEVVSAQ